MNFFKEIVKVGLAGSECFPAVYDLCRPRRERCSPKRHHSRNS